jgi:hypothetical protein
VIFNKIDLPENISGFELKKVVNYEESHKGMGYGLEYSSPGCKSTVYIYDKNSIIPNDVEDELVRSEFINNIREIFSAYTEENITVTQEPLTIETENLKLFGFGFKFKNSNIGDIHNPNLEEDISYLYLTTLFGSFVKMRLSFSATNQPERGEKIHNDFMTELFVILNSQLEQK